MPVVVGRGMQLGGMRALSRLQSSSLYFLDYSTSMRYLFSPMYISLLFVMLCVWSDVGLQLEAWRTSSRSLHRNPGNFLHRHDFKLASSLDPSIKSKDSIIKASGSIDVPKVRKSSNVNTIMTLSRFMIEATRNNPDHADLESLIESIQIACKTIANQLSRSGVTDLSGYQAEYQQAFKFKPSHAMYNMANTVLKNALRFTGKLGVAAFQDEDHPMLIDEAWNSKYIALFDPLDGASNIDVGIVTGTIFSIFQAEEECLIDFGEEVSEDTTKRLLSNLKPSKNLVAAGYCMYSSSTIMMLSLGEGVHGFTLDPFIGEFILTHPNVQIPARGEIYSLNEARAPWWPAGLNDFVQDIKMGKGETKQTYTSRYIGSMVGDVHRTLLYGGIFGYPGDSKSAPQGKLRLLHEVAPMAFLIEQAGGKASTGYGRILNTEPKTLHDHVSTLMGSKEDIDELERYLQKHKKE